MNGAPDDSPPGTITAGWRRGPDAARPRYGVYVNNRAAVFMGEAFSLDRLLENAVIAEEAGLDFVSVGDSITAKPRYTPIPVLAAIAAKTRRVGLATGILQPHMRNPVLLAQEDRKSTRLNSSHLGISYA